MRVDVPASLEELKDCVARAPEGFRLLAGGTDLVVHLRAHPEETPHLVDLWGIPELWEVRREESPEGPFLRIGAAATFADLERHPLVRRHAAALARAAASVGSTQIRNRATLGGNVAHPSPAADSLPALACLVAPARDPAVEGVTGGYWDENNQQVRSNGNSYKRETWRRLWEATEQLAGLKP